MLSSISRGFLIVIVVVATVVLAMLPADTSIAPALENVLTQIKHAQMHKHVHTGACTYTHIDQTQLM